MAGLRQSKTTNNLIAELSKIKEEKQAIVDKLNQQISKNNQIIEQPIRSFRSYSLKTIINRQRSIEQLQKRLHKKEEADRSSDAKLDSIALKHEQKRLELERRLQQIAKRNSNRLKQLKDIQENMLKKIAMDIQRNQARQKHLRGQYQRVRKQEGKLREVHRVQKKEANQQWRVLQSQKYKVELFVFENQKRQSKLIQDRNPVAIKREQKKKQEDKYIPTEKQYKKLKNVDKKDRKQVGNQYLQQVKLLHRQAIVSNKKKKLMNLNLKVINYSQAIMERIFRNTSDLSKVDKPKVLVVEEKEQNHQNKEPVRQEVALEPTPVKDHVISEDLETQRYLKQIKLNLLELQKINRDKQNEQNKSDSFNGGSEFLIIPTTIKHD